MDEPKVVSYTNNKRFRPSKRALFVVLLIVLALLCGGTLAWLQNNDTDAPETSKTGIPEDRIPKEIREIQGLALSGNAEEAEKKIQEGLSKPGATEQQKYDLLTQRAINAQNAGKYQEALDAYKEAETIKQEFKISKQIADVAALLNDKEQALEYYEKALGQLDRSLPLYEAEKEIVESKMKALES